MHKCFWIWKTELKLLFFTPLATLLGIAFYSVQGILFWYVLNQANSGKEAVQAGILQSITGGIVFWLTLWILVPALTMRLVAFEAEIETLPHLFTTSVKTWQITLGKFFAALSFYFFLWLPTSGYYGVLALYSKIDTGAAFSAYLGLLLVGAFTLSIGFWVSSFCRNQITASLGTFFALLGILVVCMCEGLLGASFGKELLLYLNYIEHHVPFSEGIVDSRDIVYFVTGTVFFLFATNETLDWKRSRHG